MLLSGTARRAYGWHGAEIRNLLTAILLRPGIERHISHSFTTFYKSDSTPKPADKPLAAEPMSRKKESWQIQKKALKKKFGEKGWAPRKRLSPDAIEGIRALHAQDPSKNSTEFLAGMFEVSPEVIRRILKSKWKPSESESEDRRHRWERRGEKIWSKMVELGMKPPKKWRERGIKPNFGAHSKTTLSNSGPSNLTVQETIPQTSHRTLSDRIL